MGELGFKEEVVFWELEEEIGYIGNFEIFYSFYIVIGFCNEKIVFYLVIDL